MNTCEKTRLFKYSGTELILRFYQFDKQTNKQTNKLLFLFFFIKKLHFSVKNQLDKLSKEVSFLPEKQPINVFLYLHFFCVSSNKK